MRRSVLEPPGCSLKSFFCVAVFVVMAVGFVCGAASEPAPTAKLEATATKANNFAFLCISSYKVIKPQILRASCREVRGV